MNAAARFGEIVVEAMDGEGRVVAKSEGVREDGTDIAVKWKEEAKGAMEGPVALRMTIRNARLYAVWAE